jgi:hypothetical protein
MSGSYTLAQYQALTAAIAGGVKEVMIDGRRVVYQTTDEMLRVRDAMRVELEAAGVIAPVVPAVTYASWDRY